MQCNTWVAVAHAFDVALTSAMYGPVEGADAQVYRVPTGSSMADRGHPFHSAGFPVPRLGLPPVRTLSLCGVWLSYVVSRLQGGGGVMTRRGWFDDGGCSWGSYG